MIFHCSTCGDVIDVPDAKLPYSGNCPFCAAPVRLDAAKAIEREAEAPPAPPPAPVRPIPPPARVTAPPPARQPNKIGGTIGAVIVIVILIIVRFSLRESKRPTPKIQVPQFQMPKFDYKYACAFCSGTKKTKCRICSVECPRCGKVRSFQNPSCPVCRKLCTTCLGTGLAECSFCKARNRDDSSKPRTPRSP